MSDTTAKFASLMERRYRSMGPEERIHIAASMFEVAREIVSSSLPRDMNARDRRMALIERLYKGELPEAALIAYSNWSAEAS